jgi:hypothetical protein
VKSWLKNCNDACCRNEIIDKHLTGFLERRLNFSTTDIEFNMSDGPKFIVILEKKGRGRGMTLVRPWTIRTFKLYGQTLEYYHGAILKGSVNIKDAKIKILLPSEADDKEFPFLLDNGEEKILFSAPSHEIRAKVIEFLKLSAKNKYWSFPLINSLVTDGHAPYQPVPESILSISPVLQTHTPKLVTNQTINQNKELATRVSELQTINRALQRHATALEEENDLLKIKIEQLELEVAPTRSA